MTDENRPENPREQRRRRERIHVIMVLGTLVLVGGGLIGVIFGPAALLTALPVLVGAAVLILALFGLMRLLDWVLDRRE